MLHFLVLLLVVSTNAYQVPEGVEKLSSYLIRNDTTYYALLVHGEALLSLDKTLDLSNWIYPRIPILSLANGPKWATGDEFQSADINVIGADQVRIYFAAKSADTNKISLGVAFSDQIVTENREYLTLNNPLSAPTDFYDDYVDPNLLLTENQLLLTYVGNYVFNNTQLSAMRAVLLTDDGLSLKSPPVTLLRPNLYWEGNKIFNQWGFEKNGYVYVIYESEGGLGVARSLASSPLGPYEKMTLPLLDRTKVMPTRHQIREALQWQTNGWPSLNF